MKKIIELWGIFTLLSVCLLIALFQEPQEEQIEWEPLIIETTPIKPDVVTLLENEITETRNWDVGCHDSTKQFTYDDAQILLRIASAEGANQGIFGMFLIMQTVVNRVASEDFPNSIAEVVFQKSQFQAVTDGRYYTVDIPPEAHEALAILESNTQVNSEIVAFEATWNNRSLTRYYDTSFTYLGHTFYTKKEN